MDPMHEIARQAIEQTPPAIRVTPEQASVIAAHADELLALGPEIVQAFYDTLYGHEPTEAVFGEGERPMREQTLGDWWTRTVRGPIDDNYWSWMAMVGLIHVIRRVTNPMMLAMAEFVADTPLQRFGQPSEVAALAVLYDWDDSALRTSPHYPADLVDYARGRLDHTESGDS